MQKAKLKHAPHFQIRRVKSPEWNQKDFWTHL